MTKKFILPMLATILVASIALAASAFRKEVKTEASKPAKLQTNYYFQYKADAPDTEAGYENPDNWTFLSGGNPGTDPCEGANEIVCVLEVAFGSTPTVTDLINYLSNLSPSISGAVTYCRDEDNIKHYKPEPMP